MKRNEWIDNLMALVAGGLFFWCLYLMLEQMA